MRRFLNLPCLPAPAHQPFSSNSLSAPEEAYRASASCAVGQDGCRIDT